MGVPAFYRWLVEKYPKVIESCKKERGKDAQKPENLEFDNLYLDMNGIIHPCFHPDSLICPPTTFEQVFENIYAYIDRLFMIVKPRKLLYLAIDGVAPRAKLNQQRARRFRTAKDNEIAEEEEKRIREEYERKGKKLLPALESEVSDSNVITPGTVFMHELSKALKSYIFEKLETDPDWREIKVILSDGTVPGEGEHKIMSFIRNQRSVPGYDPNTRHCLYGLDADLIMLALATHEIHFSILREDVVAEQNQKHASESVLLTSIHKAVECTSANSSTEEVTKPFNIRDRNQSLLILPQTFQFLHVWILREYLELDLQIDNPPENFVFDIERIVDDFVFICFFMGNDFLPHLPTLEIHENGIDLLLQVYMKEFKNLGGYLVDMQRITDPHAGYIKLKRVEKFILSVGSYEEKIFKKRAVVREKRLRRFLSQLSETLADELNLEGPEVCTTDVQGTPTCVKDNEIRNYQHNDSSSDIEEMVKNTKELKEELKNLIYKKSDIFRDTNLSSDKVKLDSPGWKQRYYKEKFSVEDPKEIEIRRKEIVQKYTEGLCLVLMYYFSGIPSWNWYYPYHYGLFASEMKGLSQARVRFQKGCPFRPFDQLMAVLPPKSSHALPRAYQELMTDSNSNISEFYPSDFEVDTDGKRFLWQGICKLLFIDQEKLLKVTCKLEEKIEINEADRNVETTDRLFMRGPDSSEGGTRVYSRQHSEKREEVHLASQEETIICSSIDLPTVCLFVPRLLEGVQPPEKTISANDIIKTVLWHEYMGRPPITRSQPHNRQRTAATYVGKDNIHEDGIHKLAGTGWGSAGRGKGAVSSNNLNPRNQNRFGYSQSSCSVPPCRGHDQSLLQPVSYRSALAPPPNANRSNWRPAGYMQNNNFWPSRRMPDPHQNPSWRPASLTKPSSSGIGNERSPMQNSPGNGNSSQFMARGRGRGPYRPNTYHEQSSQHPSRW